MASAQVLKKQEHLEAGKRKVFSFFLFSISFSNGFFALILLILCSLSTGIDCDCFVGLAVFIRDFIGFFFWCV